MGNWFVRWIAVILASSSCMAAAAAAEGYPTSTEYKERLSGIGMEPLRMTPEQAAAYTKREIEKWSKVAKAANVRLD